MSDLDEEVRGALAFPKLPSAPSALGRRALYLPWWRRTLG